jgi:hypothetical protein
MHLREKQQVPLAGYRLEHFDPRLCRRHDPQFKQLSIPIPRHIERYASLGHSLTAADVRPYLHPRTNVRKVSLKQINVHKQS